MISYKQIGFAALSALALSMLVTAPVYSQTTQTTTVYTDAPAVATGQQIVINKSDRLIIRDYLGRTVHTSTCPAGMTVSPNGCVPVGKVTQTTRTTTYTVGQPLANTVTYTTLPPDVITRLQPVPTGYEYVMVDGDVVLLSPQNRQVIDAVRWSTTDE